MTDRLLLDTHIALWLDSGDDRLRVASRALIEGCWQNGGTMLVSAVTAWEIALLVDTGRIELDIAIEAWFERFVDRPGFEVVPLSYRAACRSYRLHHLEHRDPADGQPSDPVMHGEATHVREGGDLGVGAAARPLHGQSHDEDQEEPDDREGARDAHRRTSPQYAISQPK